MFAARYVALVALVVWLGGTILLLAERVGPSILPPFDMVATACGAAIVACLFVMKFVGPPPEAFAIRAALAVAMTALALYDGMFHQATTPLMTINVVIGLVLLLWYARE